MDTPEIRLLLQLLLPYGRINSRMTSYLKIFVLIDFHFQNAIFPFNRAAPYGMTSAVPREQSRTSARSAERPLALDPRPHSSAAARASLRFLVRSATERSTSRGEISFQLPFKRYPIKNFGSNRADKSENFPLRCVHEYLHSYEANRPRSIINNIYNIHLIIILLSYMSLLYSYILL